MLRRPSDGLGERLRHRRRELGLKQAVVALRAGISASYLCELETKEGASPSAVVLQQIAEALDTTVVRLLGLPEKTASPTPGSIPLTLQRARIRYRFADDEVTLLAGIEYRGSRPRTEEDWFFVLAAIKRSVA